MPVPFKPHTFSVYAPIEGDDSGDGVEVTTWDDTAATVQGMIEPISADVAYREFAVEVRRPMRLFADADEADTFPIGTKVHCASRSEWVRVVAPPLVYDAIPEISHIEVLCERCRPDGVAL